MCLDVATAQLRQPAQINLHEADEKTKIYSYQKEDVNLSIYLISKLERVCFSNPTSRFLNLY